MSSSNTKKSGSKVLTGVLLVLGVALAPPPSAGAADRSPAIEKSQSPRLAMKTSRNQNCASCGEPEFKSGSPFRDIISFSRSLDAATAETPDTE